MLIRAMIAFVVLPGVVAGIGPWLIVRDRTHYGPYQTYGFLLLGGGLLLLLWSVRDFYVSGQGTLAPWDPPKHLVVVGLYCFVRNPMYIAVLIMLAGWTLVFGSYQVGCYACLVAVGFHLRVILFEEPKLRQQFGREWEEYSSSVRRWLPCLRPKRQICNPPSD
jgi:protein-S-isoprenylcysteine O-methyltransferase Ste14